MPTTVSGASAAGVAVGVLSASSAQTTCRSATRQVVCLRLRRGRLGIFRSIRMRAARVREGLEYVFAVAFTIELMLRIGAEGKGFAHRENANLVRLAGSNSGREIGFRGVEVGECMCKLDRA